MPLVCVIGKIDGGRFLADLRSWHSDQRYPIFIQINKGASFPSPIAINNKASLVSYVFLLIALNSLNVAFDFLFFLVFEYKIRVRMPISRLFFYLPKIQMP